MADKIKILITSDCKLGGKPIRKGEVIQIDPDNAQDKNNYALLVHAGRVGAATEENIAKLKAEIASTERIAAENKKKESGQSSAEIIAAAVVQALAAAGFAPKKA